MIDQKRVLRANTKRMALDENNNNAAVSSGLHCKKRAVLLDVTNVSCSKSYRKCFDANKIQVNMLSLAYLQYQFNYGLTSVSTFKHYGMHFQSVHGKCMLTLRCLLQKN